MLDLVVGGLSVDLCWAKQIYRGHDGYIDDLGNGQWTAEPSSWLPRLLMRRITSRSVLLDQTD